MITALSPEPLAEVANIMIPAKVHNRQPILRRGRLKELDALPVYASQALYVIPACFWPESRPASRADFCVAGFRPKTRRNDGVVLCKPFVPQGDPTKPAPAQAGVDGYARRRESRRSSQNLDSRLRMKIDFHCSL